MKLNFLEWTFYFMKISQNRNHVFLLRSTFFISNFDLKSYYKKKSVIMGFIASCSKMVCPRHLVLSDHVAISLLPLEIWLSFLSSSPFSKKTTNHDFFFALLKQLHNDSNFFCAILAREALFHFVREKFELRPSFTQKSCSRKKSTITVTHAQKEKNYDHWFHF